MCHKPGEGNAHYMMCKKIAQLTKVIYELNTQNEDNEMRVGDMRSRHEFDMRELREDTERRVEEMRKAFRAAEEERLVAVEAMQREYQEKVVAAKDAAEAAQAYRAEMEEVLAKRCAVKDDEVAGLVREYNDRYKTMLAEQLGAREELEARVAELTARLEAAQKEIMQSSGQLENAARDHARELEKLNEKHCEVSAKMEAELGHLREKCRVAEARVQQLELECATLDARLGNEGNALSDCRQAAEGLQRETEELRSQLAESMERCMNLESSLKENAMEVSRIRSTLEDTENRRSLLETERSTLKHDLQIAIERIKELEERLGGSEARLRESELRLSDAEQTKQVEADRHVQFVEALQEQCAELQRRIRELDCRHQDELAQMRAEHEVAIRDIESMSKRSNESLHDQLQRLKEDMMKKHEVDMLHARDAHREEIAKLNEAHERVISSLREELHKTGVSDEKLRAAERHLKERVAELEEALRVSAHELQESHAALKDSTSKREEEALRYAKRIQELEACAEQHRQAVMEEAAAKVAAVEARLGELRRQQESNHATSVQEWLDKVEVQKKLHAYQIKLLMFNDEQHLQYSTHKQMLVLDQLRMLCHESVCRLEMSIRQEIHAERDASQRTLDNLNGFLRQREDDVRQLEAKLERVQSSLRDQCAKLTEELNIQRSITEKRTVECEGMRASYNVALEEQKKMREECALLQQAVGTYEKRIVELQDALSSLNRAMEQETASIKQKHKDEKEELLRCEKENAKNMMEELRATLTMERDSVQQRADEVIAMLRQRLNSTKEDLRAAQIRVDSLTDDVRRRTEDIAREQKNLSEAKARFARDLEALEEEHEEKARLMQRENDAIVNELATKHKMFVDDLLQQQHDERVANTNIVKELQNALDDLRHRYDYRESRSEDVEMINRLMKEMRQKEQELKKVYSDLKFYKLELVNREENYNKVFGRRPLVASNEAVSKVPPR
uniref:Protein FAM184A/B N-terminal domain-containing protein n=1 Tax=Trypanosoma vivax (strain Y486) TaxID=1055687 RepID=G0U2U0_TRYVY|nr:conserved hypothetical protein, fragment [Trypanosoma vivax Y486]